MEDEIKKIRKTKSLTNYLRIDIKVFNNNVMYYVLEANVAQNHDQLINFHDELQVP